jgi:hypothetical protein
MTERTAAILAAVVYAGVVTAAGIALLAAVFGADALACTWQLFLGSLLCWTLMD